MLDLSDATFVPVKARHYSTTDVDVAYLVLVQMAQSLESNTELASDCIQQEVAAG
jgi:hypothetical protein